MDFLNELLHFFKAEAYVAIPILLVIVLGFAISAERFFALSSIRSRNLKAWKEFLPLLEKGKFDDVKLMAQKKPSEIGRLLILGMERSSAVRRRDDIEVAMEEGILELTPQLEKRIPYIGLYANISTLLGLLGTVIGLIKAFKAVADAPPALKSELLSASIGLAMNATALGLFGAVPMLIMFTVNSSKAAEIMTSMEMATVKTLNLITEVKKAPGQV
ncbi:MAG: MotA/TolQ/ExbB proton channel family protein [Methylacidiphilales bacterium]|nr:MotA/TolQ/ExbB proton channel family protein [Candidatus Methylacidiphilales bacterium]